MNNLINQLNKSAKQIIFDTVIRYPQSALGEAAHINGFTAVDIDEGQNNILYYNEQDNQYINCRTGSHIQAICDTGLGFDDNIGWSVFCEL